MSKFPKPWTMTQVDPGPTFNLVVEDATGRKLFYISADDNPDGEGEPGADDGPTVYGYADDQEEMLEKLDEMFERPEAAE